MFPPFSGWAIIRLRPEYPRKLIYYSVDIKNGGTRSRFTMFGEVCGYATPQTLYDYISFLRYSILNLMMVHPEKGRNMYLIYSKI
jgi:hypothetical protein